MLEPVKVARNRTSEQQIHGPRSIQLAVNGVSGTRGSTQLFLKLKVCVLQRKLSSICARGILMSTKQRTIQ